MKYIFTLAISTALLFLTVNSVSAFYCKDKIIQKGLTKGEVRRLCGKPAFEDKRDEDRIEDSRDGKDNIIIRVKVDEWMYNFGPDKFIQILIFEKGRLQEIRAGEYGWDPKVDRNKDCSSTTLLLGVSKSDIFIKCGSPNEKESWQKSFKAGESSRSRQRIVQIHEDWTYESAHGNSIVFKFIDGKLTGVQGND